MNKQELIERIEGLKNIFGNKCEYVKIDFMIKLVSELDELETGHADEAPRYVKNILARLRELPLHDREVWLKAIMSEFEQDFSHAKWREGYEQGKFEGAMIPYDEPEKVNLWLCENELNRQNIFARAWILGYEVEKEKRYRISMPKARNYKNHAQFLCEKDGKMFWCAEWHRFRTKFTRKELEEAGFGWVFSCEGIDIEEVE